MCMLNNHDHVLPIAAAAKNRLPQTVVPENYDVEITPDLKNFTFTGNEIIDLRVKERVSEIVLNCSQIEISEASVVDDAGTRLNGTVIYDEANEQASIKFAGTVGKGRWQLFLAFSGQINDQLKGFYRSTYKDAAGKEHVIASTQFEPNDARRAFPCFDEPSFKATFEIALIVDEHLTAIGNGPIENTQALGNGKKRVEFKKTMKMSTYIVAYVIGEFECTPTIIAGNKNTEIRVYHVPGKSKQATFALRAAQFSVVWYERYFGINYPGDKMDLIGIPDFAFGAMENVGCITFRETALLVNENTATIAEMSRVAEVVAHEIAHQWFGNLVTMKWWNGLWLNEAFATFMATLVEDAFHKEWDRWTNFGLERAAAFRTDGLSSTRSIEAPVLRPAEALGMIDVITYRKGCSVLRQLQQYIGENNFRNGIRAYLRKHSYANAETTDLWDAIGSACPQFRVREIMDSWVFQPGYPLISVSEGIVDGGVTLTQSGFRYLNETQASADAPAPHWLVPVCLRFMADGEESSLWVLLDKPEQHVYLGEKLSWVVANAGGHGFYRARYSPKLAASVVNNVGLSAIERFNVVNDAWACVQAGLQTSHEFLDMVELFGSETDPNVWSAISDALGQLHSMLPKTNRASFEEFVRKLAQPSLARLGWQPKDGESALDKQLRGTVVALLGTAGNDAQVQAKAKELFTAYKADKTSVPSDLVPAVVGLVAHSGGEAEYADFLSLMEKTNVPQEAVRFLGALASFRDKQLLQRTLQSTLDGKAVRSQDLPSVLVRLLANPVIRDEAWKFITTNWSTITAKLPAMLSIRLTSGVVYLDTPEMEADVRKFLAQNPLPGGEKAVAQNLELLRIGVVFNQRESQSLSACFAPAAQAEGSKSKDEPASEVKNVPAAEAKDSSAK